MKVVQRRLLAGEAAFPSETVISRREILNKTSLSSSPPPPKWLHFVNCKDQQDKRKAAFPGDAESLDSPKCVFLS